MKSLLPLSLATGITLSLVSCEYENTYQQGYRSTYSTQKQSNAIIFQSTGAPVAKLPAQLGIVRVEKNHRNELYIPKGVIHESESDAQVLSQLSGIRSVLMLNSVMANQTFADMASLRQEARRYGVNVIGLYSIETNVKRKDCAWPLTIATLGILPNQEMKINSMATFSIIDAKSGYFYGSSSTIEKNKTLATSINYYAAKKEHINETEYSAYQAMLQKIPSAWSHASRQMR